MLVSEGAVITFLVITSLVRRFGSANLTSLPVTIPTSFSPSTTGNPEMLCFCISSVAYLTVSVGPIVITSLITSDSARFTFLAISTCSSTVQLRCRTPSPPRRASEMAISLSVTVSMGLDTNGTLMEWFTVILVDNSTWPASTSVQPGSRIRSRKVTATSVSLTLDLNPPSDTIRKASHGFFEWRVVLPYYTYLHQTSSIG